MDRLLTLFSVVLLLAVIQAAVVALAIALVLALLYFGVTRPRETLAFVVSSVVIGLAGAHPTAALVVVGVVGVTAVVIPVVRPDAALPTAQGPRLGRKLGRGDPKQPFPRRSDIHPH